MSLRRRRQALLVLVAALLGVLILLRLPRPIAAVGTLDQCLGGWPVVVFEGEEWRRALPIHRQASAQRRIPIATWPSGLRFDESAGVLLDAAEDVVFRKGDRVTVKGSVIEVHGDPSPCYYTLGVKVDEITAP